MLAWIEMPSVWQRGYLWVVASYMLAWIEIFPAAMSIILKRRKLHACVDWNKPCCVSVFLTDTSRKLYACVDWNGEQYDTLIVFKRRKLYACVDWNLGLSFGLVDLYVASYTLAWIEIPFAIQRALSAFRRKLHACVGWNDLLITNELLYQRRKLYACMNWNIIILL